MTYFEWCEYAYNHGWASIEQLKMWVSSGKITPEDFQTITGQEYTA